MKPHRSSQHHIIVKPTTMRIIFASLALMLLVSQINATCLCGAKGVDHCSCSGIRPVPQYIHRGVSNLKPIGDKCYCGQQVVEPAVLPKIGCEKESCGCGCESESDPDPVPYVEPKDQGPPADPVSVGLAYSINAAKHFSVPEAKLSFGYNKPPLNGLPKVSHGNIPEEKLWKTKSGPIIELKRSYYKPAEEEFEEVEEEEEEYSADLPSPYLSYGELGYGPAAAVNPKFKYVSSDQVSIEKPSKKRDYSCGFKLGQITQNADISNSGFLYEGDEDCFGRL